MLRHTLDMFRSSTARGLALSHRKALSHPKAFSSANGAVQSSSFSKKLIMGGLVGAAGAAQLLLCPQDDWYHYTFKTSKDPDCLADFYGGEVCPRWLTFLPIRTCRPYGHAYMRSSLFVLVRDAKGHQVACNPMYCCAQSVRS
eukprot:COSAG02_NODE_6536_length_3511_cov_1.873974_4_plen_143_part_00